MIHATNTHSKSKTQRLTVEQIALELNGKKTASGWKCLCPAHDDRNPSLTLSEGTDGAILYHCHAGCSQESVASALKSKNLLDAKSPQKADKYTEYFYSSPTGERVLKVTRIDKASGGKSFIQSKMENGKWVLGGYKGELVPYKYEEWKESKERWVFHVEGEKAADALVAKGFLATTTPGGASNWRSGFAKFFKDKNVVVLPDNDIPGEKYAKSAYVDIREQAAKVKYLNLPGLIDKEDVFDWFKKGHQATELREMVSKTEDQYQELVFQPKVTPEAKSQSSEPVPLPLRRAQIAPEPFPVEHLGSILGAACKRIIESVKAPDAIVAQSLLGGAALATQGLCDVTVDGRSNPISLFLLSIADSGERKSAVDHLALLPHREHEKYLKSKYDELKLEYELDKSAYDSAKTEALKYSVTRDEKKSALLLVGDPPKAPLNPMILCEEPTSEGLFKLYQNGQPSLGVFSDEGGRLFGGHGMSPENQLKTCTAFSEFWDGKRTARVRSGDGATLLYGKRLSMHMMIQGIVAQAVLSNDIFDQQGLLARTLIAWPQSMAGSRQYEEVDLSHDAALRAYNARLATLLNRPLLLTENTTNELNPRKIGLAADAKNWWVKFYNNIESQMAEGKELFPIRALASKAPQHSLRLSAVLTLVNDPDAGSIGKDEIISGIELMQFYLGETLRLKMTGGADPDILLAEKLLAWAKPQEFVYLKKIYQSGPYAIRDAKRAKKIIKILEDHGWLARIEGSHVIDGSLRKEVWRVYQ